MYHGKRLADEDPDLLQLMWADFSVSPDRHFYIKEVARTYSRKLVILIKWICAVNKTSDRAEQTETYFTDVYHVQFDDQV